MKPDLPPVNVKLLEKEYNNTLESLQKHPAQTRLIVNVIEDLRQEHLSNIKPYFQETSRKIPHQIYVLDAFHFRMHRLKLAHAWKAAPPEERNDPHVICQVLRASNWGINYWFKGGRSEYRRSLEKSTDYELGSNFTGWAVYTLLSPEMQRNFLVARTFIQQGGDISMIPHKELITYTPQQQRTLLACSDQVQDRIWHFCRELNTRCGLDEEEVQDRKWRDRLEFKQTCSLDLWEKFLPTPVVCQVLLVNGVLGFKGMGGDELTAEQLQELEEIEGVTYILPDKQKFRYRFEFCDATNTRLADTFYEMIAQHLQERQT